MFTLKMNHLSLDRSFVSISEAVEHSYKCAMMQCNVIKKIYIDYMYSLRKSYNTNNATVFEQLRIQRINDTFNYDKVSHQTLIKG